MSSDGGKVWAAGTTENTKVLIGRRCAIESRVRA
jgi:hypothetical protein